MAGMRELSEHIIYVAKHNSIPITNLQLQKVMFFSFGFHLSKQGIDDLAIATYDEKFEKWQYGPVVPSVYYTYNIYRDKEIQSNGKYSTVYCGWDDLISKLLRVDVFYLVKVSHNLSSWSKYKDDIINRRYVAPYSIDEILEDFNQ